MPLPQLTYPGVYIQELPSSQHAITGVATSIGAFIGWADQGPTTEAVLCNSFSDFNTIFGGLDNRSYLGYAVSQFFANGGQQAYVVRVVDTDAKPGAVSVGGLTINASNAGNWSTSYSVTTTASATNSSGASVFNLSLTQTMADGSTQLMESYTGLSLDPTQPSYIVTTLNNDSNFMTVPTSPALPSAVTAGTAAFSGGSFGTVLAPYGSVPKNGAGLAGLGSTTGGIEAFVAPTSLSGGVYLLNSVPIFNILCVPGLTDTATISTLQGFCQAARAFMIVDCPPDVPFPSTPPTQAFGTTSEGADPNPLTPTTSSAYSAYYYPWVSAPDPLAGGRNCLFPPCGFVAGQYAATDATRGVWKAPAGIETGLSGVTGLQYVLTDKQQGSFNPVGINVIRQFPAFGNIVWGARTLLGSDVEASQWKYVPIRRLASYIESSVYQGTQWAVFEPNDTPLWGQVRLSIGSFMQSLFLQGAFQGSSPQQAYFVKCDSENNPQMNIDLGILTVTVGFMPLFPAEFVVIQIQQMMAS